MSNVLVAVDIGWRLAGASGVIVDRCDDGDDSYGTPYTVRIDGAGELATIPACLLEEA